MSLPGIDSLLWVAGYGATAILIVAIFSRGLHRTFPIFTGYLISALVTDPLLYWVHSQFPTRYFDSYFAMNGVDYLFQLALLFEIGANIVRPVRKSLPAGVVWLLAGFLVAAATVTAIFAFYSTPHSLSHLGVIFVKMNLGMAVLRLGIFVSIAAFAQMLGIGWKSHVLQLATGLAFYSAISLIVASAQSSTGLTHLFHPLAQIQVASYVGTLAFWIWSFAREEAPRKEFSPQMENFLLSIAGSTRSERLALQAGIDKPRNRER
ncbi:MAG TPA: hypothetical protein VM554_12285 [Acidisarcina sp.]|nr:hypothetical protein [Acidisarcina sp.]